MKVKTAFRSHTSRISSAEEPVWLVAPGLGSERASLSSQKAPGEARAGGSTIAKPPRGRQPLL